MENAIETRNLTVVFPARKGPIKALDGLNLSVQTGQVVGFLGPNGAGKTTAMHVLLGFIRPTSGEARIFGQDARRSIARQRIGYLPEHPDTYRFLTGRELLRMTGRLFDMSGAALGVRIADLLRLTGIDEAADRRVGAYSRGMMQRICLCQALINDPDLVILDEPTGGLDPLGRMEIRKMIADLRGCGKTVFFSSHELSEVETVCDHAIVLNRGRILAEGPIASLAGPGESLEKYFIRVVTAASRPERMAEQPGESS
ncbi:MAG: ABC transporter ATP-binding protein [Verrucomicrobiota bacterium]|nr:ABC transporter ATP-binding protein [Verrucomicrobiota bacterium]